jgi:aminoglycoside phosphotransferase (APT) family kinase protein
VTAGGGSIGHMSGSDHDGLTPLAGGYSGETFLAQAAGERTVVRIYAARGATRGPQAPEVDAAVLRLVRGLLPVAQVLDAQPPRPAAGTPGLLVTSFLPGQRLDLVLPALDAAGRAAVGRHLGILLGRLATMPMPRPGIFVDAGLRVEPLPPGDLVDFVAGHRARTAIASWPPDAYDGLLDVADRAQRVLDRVRRTCLVHGDLNPKNLLVDPGTLEVTGLLDWEFAYAGLPGTDLGNLLRFERDDDLATAVLGSYRAAVPDASDGVLEEARAADLFALVDLAGRRGENPVTERAHEQLLAVARSGDLHAVPAP